MYGTNNQFKNNIFKPLNYFYFFLFSHPDNLPIYICVEGKPKLVRRYECAKKNSGRECSGIW
jgi:hypothetical protein